MQLCRKSVNLMKIQTLFKKESVRKKRKNISEATIHFNSDISKSILTFFKKSDTNSGSNVKSINNPDDASHVNSVNNINHSDTHTSVNSNNSGPSLTHLSIYGPPKSYAFPKTTIGN